MPEASDSGPKRTSALIRLIARVVPASGREAWLKEWLSEVWHAYFGLLRDGVAEEDADRGLTGVCAGAFRDATLLRLRWVRESIAPSRLLGQPMAVLGLIAGLAIALAAGTHGFRHIREAIRGLPYPEAQKLVLLRRAAQVLGMNAPPSARLGETWAVHQNPYVRVAAFAWDRKHKPAQGDVLLITDNFFDVLGMKPAIGGAFAKSSGGPEIVLSDATWRSDFGADSRVIGRTVRIAGSDWRVAGVMPASFSFLGRPVAGLAKLDASNAPPYVNALGRLSDVRALEQAEKVLANVGRRKFIVHVEATSLQERVRRPLVVGLWAAALMILIAVAWGLLRRVFPGSRTTPSRWFTMFFILKTGGLATVICLAWAEIVTGQRIAENGALEMNALFFMLLLVGIQCGALAWAYYDQEKRCRTCCLPVAQPVMFGTWSSMLLDQPAVEFLCPNGHGSLFEPELNSGPGERPTWTSFDDTWKGVGV